MFEEPRHQDALRILAALDADRLASTGFLFGGGTRIVLELDEFRQSLDIDFLCSDAAGYSELRRLAKTRGYPALFPDAERSGLAFPREIRIDQYGIRFPVSLNGRGVKVELIREARLALDPGMKPDWSPVPCLSIVDCYALKLLANSDRWADRQVLARDLIDLAALRRGFGPVPGGSWRKAESAYGPIVREDLRKAVHQLLSQDGFQKRCLEGLKVKRPEELLRELPRLEEDSRATQAPVETSET